MTVDPVIDAVLVDTCVFSFFQNGDPREEIYRPHLEGKNLFLSLMTVAELERWALERNWGEERRLRMEIFIQNHFTIYNAVDGRLCRTWAEVTDRRRRSGRLIQCADA